ncbi:MAG: hypothetical protein V4629_07225 [Pseudomonadota bacterium]
MPGYDFGGVDGRALDIVALGQILADAVGKAYDQATVHAGKIAADEVVGEADTADQIAAGTGDDKTVFDVGEMAQFMLSMMVFGTALKTLFSVTSLIKDFGDFAAQKL